MTKISSLLGVGEAFLNFITSLILVTVLFGLMSHENPPKQKNGVWLTLENESVSPMVVLVKAQIHLLNSVPLSPRAQTTTTVKGSTVWSSKGAPEAGGAQRQGILNTLVYPHSHNSTHILTQLHPL